MTQNDGKMDQDCMNKWLQDVWFKYVKRFVYKKENLSLVSKTKIIIIVCIYGHIFLFRKVISPNILIADVYEPHTSLITQEKFLLNKSNLCVIPGGCSSKLQPLEIAVKRKFQVYIKLVF